MLWISPACFCFAVVRRTGSTLRRAFIACFGDLSTYFSDVAVKLHHWLIRSDHSLDFFVRFERQDTVTKRQEGVDRLMAYVFTFYQGSQDLHAFLREQAGLSDKEQRTRWGVVLFRSWRRLVSKCKQLLPTLQFGAIFPEDPTQPLGAFVNAPRIAIDEVAANADIATHSSVNTASVSTFTFTTDFSIYIHIWIFLTRLSTVDLISRIRFHLIRFTCLTRLYTSDPI